MNTRKALLLLASAAVVISGLSCSAQSIPVGLSSNPETTSCARPAKWIRSLKSVVSTNWLHYRLRRVTVIDVRSAEEYTAGHIPNSINIPFDVVSVWAQSDFAPGGLWLELPEITQFIENLGNNGISKRSRIVLVTSLPTETNPYSLAAPTRVALTLAYAGVRETSILDGGFDKWSDEGKPVTTDVTNIEPETFKFTSASNLFVDIDYIEKNLGKVVLIDARDTEVYNGSILEPFADKPGHIPTALSLPAPSLWNSDGTYKSRYKIRAIARNIIGRNKGKKIVVYCGVGGYASTVWYALTNILDYRNVKVYDGSAQEWVQTNDMEM